MEALDAATTASLAGWLSLDLTYNDAAAGGMSIVEGSNCFI
jgi:hypothetical protein